MRVVGGEARGRQFRAPPGRSTRPTSDRTREAIFGVLGSLAADVGVAVEDATVADLFAGSGAFGIEALSRGASRAVFVDDDRQAVATIGDNLEALGLSGPRARVVRSDALRWLQGADPTDVVLCDPPYSFDRWPSLASLLIPVATLVVLESGARLDLGPGWEVLREKHYGGTFVTVARPARSPAVPAPAHDRKGDV
jgi:16S rRNA (guanine966-N2)-methyltransferase